MDRWFPREATSKLSISQSLVFNYQSAKFVLILVLGLLQELDLVLYYLLVDCLKIKLKKIFSVISNLVPAEKVRLGCGVRWAHLSLTKAYCDTTKKLVSRLYYSAISSDP